MARKELGSGMKSPTMPKEHFVKSIPPVESQTKRYASEMNAAEEYKAANDGLANFVRNHRMKY